MKNSKIIKLDENGKQNPRFKNIEQGASTSVWAAIAPELENRGGLYLEDCQVKSQVDPEEALEALKSGFKNGYPKGPIPYAINPDNAKKLWEISENLISAIH